jgi:hypothetical protein
MVAQVPQVGGGHTQLEQTWVGLPNVGARKRNMKRGFDIGAVRLLLASCGDVLWAATGPHPNVISGLNVICIETSKPIRVEANARRD